MIQTQIEDMLAEEILSGKSSREMMWKSAW